MKYLLVLVALVGLANCAVLTRPAIPSQLKDVQSRTLLEDWEDFVALLPLQEMLDIVFLSLDDPEVQEVIIYMFSDQFKALLVEVNETPEFVDIVEYLESIDIPAKQWIANFFDILGIPSERSMRVVRVGGMKGLIDALSDVIDWDLLETFYKGKLVTSAEFKALFDNLGSAEFKKLTEAFAANKRIQEISAELTSHGVDIAGLIQLLKGLFGLN